MSYSAVSCCRYSQGHYYWHLDNSKVRKLRPDRLGHIVRRQMRIMLFGHARVGMAKLARDDAERDTLHGEVAAVGMPKHMEAHRRRDFGGLAGELERSHLLRLRPVVAIDEGKRARGRPSRWSRLKTALAVVGQHDMADPPFGQADRQRAAVRVVVAAGQAGELGVAAAGENGRLNQPPEFPLARIDQAAGFIGGQIADHRLFDFRKRFDTAPGMVGGNPSRPGRRD